MSHYLLRARLTMELLERLDLVNRTSELARLFGIQFYDVLARGSQVRLTVHDVLAGAPQVRLTVFDVLAR